MARKTLQEALGTVQRVHQHQLYDNNPTEPVVRGGWRENYSQNMIPDKQTEVRLTDGGLKGKRAGLCVFKINLWHGSDVKCNN